jgi:hypothetical protein
MVNAKWAWFAVVFVIFSLLVISTQVYATPSSGEMIPAVTPSGDIAMQAELASARAEWEQSAHSDTFDQGVGANTTCAKCKSPKNWDPYAPAAGNELNCSACKRIPGAPRPELEGRIPVAQEEWRNITCEICHQPVGDSYSVSIVFWDKQQGKYVPVESEHELCAKCHEGRHGFEVIEEQTSSPAHTGWECSRCHGSHGNPATCEDCHDPMVGAGVKDHARHEEVSCTACHDAGGLSVWHDSESSSRHIGEIIPVRFAHALTSWPSHNIQLEVRCQRCHHPQQKYSGILAGTVPCTVCHPEGASLFWCVGLPRDQEPPYKNIFDLNLPNPWEAGITKP